VGRDSVVCIATCHGLDGLGIESQWGARFYAPVRTSLGPNQPLVQWAPGLFSRGKVARRGIDHPSQSSAEVKERVHLYLYSPSGPSWLVLGWILPFTF
jgi:hypothetical protein